MALDYRRRKKICFELVTLETPSTILSPATSEGGRGPVLLAVESPRVDLGHGGGDIGAGDMADPGPIRGEHRGHVTRSQPITAHLVWCRSGHDTPPLLSGRVTSQPISNEYRGHVAGVDQ